MLKKRRCLCMVIALVLVSFALIGLVSCDKIGDTKINEYYIKVAVENDFKNVKCVTDIALYYDGEKSESLNLLMNSAAFSDKLVCENSSIKDAYPKGESYGAVDITSATIDGENSQSIIENNVLRLAGVFKKGKKYDIRIEYSLTMPFNILRYGYNDYSLNLAHFYPQYAPIYDYDYNGDPFNSYADNYKADIEYPSGFQVVASGDLISSVNEGSRIRDTYTAKHCRDYSIVIARNYNMLSAEVDGTKVNYIYSTDKTPETTFNSALKAVETFNAIFGKYERDTLQIAETEFLHGGMEYSGLITVANDTQALERERVVIHEIAHQWWYDAVHSDQILHAWQDEGLTEFSVYLYYSEIGDTDTAEKLIWNAKSSVNMYRDMVAHEGAAIDERIDRPITEFNNGSDYTFSTYVKGQLMFNYIYETLGKEKFLSALSEYYKENKWRRMTLPADIIKKFDDKLSGIELVINAWLEGKIYSL